MGDPESSEMDEEDFEVVDEYTGEDDEEEELLQKTEIIEPEESPEQSGKLIDQTEKPPEESANKNIADAADVTDDAEITEIVVIEKNTPAPVQHDSSAKTTDNCAKNTPDIISLDNDDANQETTPVESCPSVQPKQSNTIDFTADVSFDEAEILQNLSDIQNISLDPESFGIHAAAVEADKLLSKALSQNSGENVDNNENENTAESSDVVVLGESGKNEGDDQSQVQGPPWYEEKLNGKISTAKERLTKLSRVLKRSYSCYQECLDRVEAAVGTPVCKLFPPRRCPLSEPYINRWRFVCTKKPVEESAIAKMEDDNVDMTIDNVDKKIETVWRLEPSDGLTRNSNNDYQKIPTFVMSVVKTFEHYVNSTDQSDLLESPRKELSKASDDTRSTSDVMEDIIEITDKETDIEKELTEPSEQEQEQWLWLLVRCNRKNELMLFATGKCISGSTMDSLKQYFEKGRGNEFNVKSLYCKSLTKVNNVTTANTTFLLGTEALDENIADLKIQLAPKTNFWLSTLGAEQLAKQVESMIIPTPNNLVLDIGCGLGLIGLMMAPKCESVIGVDLPSEVEEAEMTSELNKIGNATFLMGNPSEVMSEISEKANCKKTSAVINTNTDVGRNIDIITGLRMIPSLRRVVMITTLTKQSVHSILTLIQPADDVLGDPFVPIRAIVVDTLPIGPQFEVIIRMDRRPMHRILNMYLTKPTIKPKASPNQPAKNLTPNASPKGKNNGKKFPSPKKNFNSKNLKNDINNKKLSPTKLNSPIKSNSPRGKPHLPNQKGRPDKTHGPGQKLVKNPFYDKPTKFRDNKKQLKSVISKRKPGGKVSPRNNSNDRRNRKFDGPFDQQKEIPKRKREWGDDFNPSNVDKKIRLPDSNDDDLRFRLSSTRMDPPDLIQHMEKQQQLLEVAKEKLSGTRSSVDSSTAKQLQNMLKIAIENTNQVQTQLRRSVWDRIAPQEKDYANQEFDTSPVFKGHFVKNLGQEDIIITTPNNEFVPPAEPSRSTSYNIPPVEPILLLPKEKWVALPEARIENYRQSLRERGQKESRKRDDFPKNSWTPVSCSRRSSKQSPPRHFDAVSPRRAIISPPKRLSSPPRTNTQQNYQQMNRSFDADMPINQRRFSPSRRASSPHRQRSPIRPRAPSPPRRRSSPLRRIPSPMRMADDWDIPTRGAAEQHANWQRSMERQQPMRSDLPPLMGLRNSLENSWNNMNNSANESWNISSGSGGIGGGGDAWNNKLMANKSENRFSTSSDNFNIRGSETFNKINTSRNESWMDKPRWEPQQNKNTWNSSGDRDREDWNDLPEDARDPWGDDGGVGSSDRWKFDAPQSSNSWARDDPIDNNWQNNSSMMNMNMNTKPPWAGSNMGNDKNVNNRWGTTNDMKIQPLPSQQQQSTMGSNNWQQGNNNSNWRGNQSQNTPGFQRLRYFQYNLK